MLATLLFDSRGLLTISPVLVDGRGRHGAALPARAAAPRRSTIAGVCLCYLIYNSGYYLPFGGGFMGPRFLTTMLPFLACPLGLALKRLPGPTSRSPAPRSRRRTIATITHPLVGYENETVVWTRLLSKG